LLWLLQQFYLYSATITYNCSQLILLLYYYYHLYCHYNNTNLITTLGYLYFILKLLTLHLVYRARSSEKSNKYIIKPPKASDNFFHSLFLPFEGLVCFSKDAGFNNAFYTYTQREKEYYYTFILLILINQYVTRARVYNTHYSPTHT